MGLEEVFTISEVAAAYHVSEETIRRWIKLKQIDFITIGPFKLKRLHPKSLIKENSNGGSISEGVGGGKKEGTI